MIPDPHKHPVMTGLARELPLERRSWHPTGGVRLLRKSATATKFASRRPFHFVDLPSINELPARRTGRHPNPP
jgi:hypothetical protein